MQKPLTNLWSFSTYLLINAKSEYFSSWQGHRPRWTTDLHKARPYHKLSMARAMRTRLVTVGKLPVLPEILELGVGSIARVDNAVHDKQRRQTSEQRKAAAAAREAEQLLARAEAQLREAQRKVDALKQR
jgi:hypothetical protein